MNKILERKVCWTCGVALNPCVCAYIKPLISQHEWILLMHPKEFKYERCGTGRMLSASLRPMSRFIGVHFEEDLEFQRMLREKNSSTYLLWPSAGSQTAQAYSQMWLDEMKEKQTLTKRFILIDATWPSAKKIFNQNPSLQKLPQIKLSDPGVSEFVIKQQPKAGCLSTLECAVKLLNELRECGLEEAKDWNSLLTPFRHMQDLQRQLASDPERTGYRRKAYQIDAVLERQNSGTRKRMRGKALST